MRATKGCVCAVAGLLLPEATLAFLPWHRSFPRLLHLAAKIGTTTIHYSANFHRHVVCKKGAVKESFIWLDEAMAKYPDAKFAPLCISTNLIDGDDTTNEKPVSTKRRKRAVLEVLDNQVLRTLPSLEAAASDLGATESNMYDVIRKERLFRGKSYVYASDTDGAKMKSAPMIAGGGLEEDLAYNLTFEPTPSYFSMSKINQETLQKYENVIDSLDSKLAASFFNHFPKADHAWIQERILFFLAPQPKSFAQKDWGRTFCVDGKGVGLTESQTVTAILALRHLLQLYPYDSSSGKPTLPFFYQQLKVNFDVMDQARVELAYWTSGACSADLMTFAFLNSLLVSWDQCRILLETLSTSVVSCELEPSWELSSLSRPVRTQLDEASLHYLRMRLCLSPSEIFEMMKTHSRLSCYSMENLKFHMDALQSMLSLSSRDLRALVVKAPSILGTSVQKLDQRMLFLSHEVNMTSAQIQKLALQFPSLLQYSVESNLRPKVCYLKQDLGISSANLTKMIMSNPSLLGRSLNKTFVPTVEGLRNDCGLSLADIRSMVVQVPQILTSNWKTNLKQKLFYLEQRLGLSDASLRAFLTSCPRLLVHSIVKSLEPKLQILEMASGDSESAIKVVIENPSLLLTNRAQFDRRVQSFKQSNFTFVDTFSGSSNVHKSRQKKAVLELLDGHLVRTLPSVEAAASDIGTSKFNLYNIIKTKRLFNGKSYAYGVNPDRKLRTGKQISSVSLRKSKDEKRKERFLQDFRVNYVPNESSMRLIELLQSPSALGDTGLTIGFEEKKIYLAIFVSSQIFPPKKVSGARGTRKAGGHSIYVPQLQGIHTGGKLLRAAAERCFTNLMPSGTEGTSYADGLMLLGYPYKRPTKSRCGLYVCRDALRFVCELLLNNRDSEFKESTMHIDIFTDSNYAWELLNNSTDLLRWGAYQRKDDFLFDGDTPEWKANIDILYPLSRTYYRLVEQDFLPEKGNSTKFPKPVAEEIKVHFRHKSEVGWSQEDSTLHTIDSYAEKAAAWQYERANEFPII